ncbi:MAG: 2-oxo acid dehydrogenase subunit E2 [Bacteroidales bacterium]|nr:2-oxo acid dehydrogenase subunit E2 [Bacteroidales bacterium]MBN2632922.1 2-oxo acid dehydrogenase subunit E2 [Bacteroidales bacterium]
MAKPVIMPKQGQSVETCILTKWYKSKGDKVAVNDLLFSYETDKAAFEMEAPAEGILLETFFDEGAEVPVLVNVAVIGQPGEQIAQYYPGSSSPAEETVSGEKNAEEKKTPSVSLKTEIADSGSSDDERIRISPRAKKFASEKGVDILNIAGSGPNGRIVVADIENAIAGAPLSPALTIAQPPSTEFTEQPVSNVRRIIAKAMHSSLQNSAQLTHHMSADVRRLLEARKKIKEGLASGKEKHDITLNDMICWCVIKALKKFPEANSHFLGDRIKTFNTVHLGIAVDTPRGLMVPAVKNADRMDIRQLSTGLRSAADACRKGNIDPELIQSTAASFTVSNLGNYGVEMFTPVINLPQAAILGVCTITHRPAEIWNNQFVFVPFIGLSLTYDHRAIDGGPATLFLREIKDQIENFSL